MEADEIDVTPETQPGRPIPYPTYGMGEEDDGEVPKVLDNGERWKAALHTIDKVRIVRWKAKGPRAGRRIPRAFKSAYRAMLTNILTEHALKRGHTEEQRRLDTVMICIQGMLHGIEPGERDERSKHLHARYHAFLKGEFDQLFEVKNESKNAKTMVKTMRARSRQGRQP